MKDCFVERFSLLAVVILALAGCSEAISFGGSPVSESYKLDGNMSGSGRLVVFTDGSRCVYVNDGGVDCDWVPRK